jgi:hypothetical protein
LNISYGNPELGPQTSHALSAQLRYAKGGTFAGINIDGSYSGNKILQYASFDPQTGIHQNDQPEYREGISIGSEPEFQYEDHSQMEPVPEWFGPLQHRNK